MVRITYIIQYEYLDERVVKRVTDLVDGFIICGQVI